METKSHVLTKLEKSALESMWTDCSDRAVKGFSGTIGREVKIDSFSIKTMVLNEVPKMLNPEDTRTTVFWVPIKGEISGVILLSSAYYDILKMADMLLKKEPGHYKIIDEENISVINELVYIIVGYYMDLLIKLFNIKMEEPSWSAIPYKMIEFMGFGNVYKERIEVLAFQTEFLIPAECIKGNIVLIFKKETAETVIRKLSSKMKISFDV